MDNEVKYHHLRLFEAQNKALLENSEVKMIEIFVPGIPRPGGSKRVWKNKYTGKFNTVDAGKYTKEWRAVVSHFANEAMRNKELLTGAVELNIEFYFARPKSHYGTGRNSLKLKPSAPEHHTQKPDRTKLLRSTEDALKGIVWRDDSQVIGGDVRKDWTDTTYPTTPKPGALIRIVEQK